MTTAKLILTTFEGNARTDDGGKTFSQIFEGNLGVSFDADSETLHFQYEYEEFGMGRKQALNIKIDGVDEIEALARYLQMILEQTKALGDGGSNE
ncbi:hypothetical protein CHR62_09215 [Pusillimonas sp. NJUB218]|nr:hypothetical protein CHR62_09215 [Pusillimonas sp. NJUB218]